MEIEYVDKRLALIETPRAADTMLPVAVIQTVRRRLPIIKAAPDVRTMLNWKSLGLREQTESAGEYFVSLSAQWMMILHIKEKNNAMTVVIRGIEEQVRGAA